MRTTSEKLEDLYDRAINAQSDDHEEFRDILIDLIMEVRVLNKRLNATQESEEDETGIGDYNAGEFYK